VCVITGCFFSSRCACIFKAGGSLIAPSALGAYWMVKMRIQRDAIHDLTDKSTQLRESRRHQLYACRLYRELGQLSIAAIMPTSIDFDIDFVIS